MAKKTFLSRFFGSESKAAPAEERPADADTSLAKEPAAPPPPAPPPEPAALPLRRDHAIFKLWELYQQQCPQAPMPHIRMASPDLTVLTEAEVKKELVRLQMTVNNSANQRVKEAIPPQKKKPAPKPLPEGEEPEAEEEEDPTPDLDAKVIVHLTAGKKLTAWVLVYPPVGQGRELDRSMLNQALDEKEVTFGLDEALLSRLPKEDHRYFCLFLAAQGELPVHGKDGHVVDLFARKAEQKIPVDEYGQMDYTTLNIIQNVQDGEVICRIIHPTEGTPGTSVLGEEIPAKNGAKANVPQGVNTKITEDGGALVAAATGHVKFDGRGFQVRSVMEVEGNVDYSVGNINYVGDVHIRGDVLSGFSVQAMGDITVDGVVEACTIEAGGDLIVTKGIVGNEQAVIRAKNDIFTKFVEGACIFVKNSLRTDCIMNSDVYSNGTIQVRTGRATILGGRIRAAKEISANVVGSPAESGTVITLGGLPWEEYEKEVLVRKIGELEKDIEKTELQPGSPHKLTHLSMTRLKLTTSQRRLEQIEKALRAYRDDTEARKNPGHLLCTTAYGGTDITIGSANLRLIHETHPCHVRLKDGELDFF